MSFEVVWTQKAKDTFNNNLDYLYEDWDNKVVNDFIDRVDEVVALIESSPKLFPVHKSRKHIHKCVVTPQITLYYKIVNNKSIELQAFWNVYQNPKKLKF